MNDDPIIQDFHDKVDERIARYTRAILDGACSCFEDYKNKVGIIKGYKESKQVLDECIKGYIDKD